MLLEYTPFLDGAWEFQATNLNCSKSPFLIVDCFLKGVVVTEDTSGEQFIIECKGNLMLESKFNEDNPVLKKYGILIYYLCII